MLTCQQRQNELTLLNRSQVRFITLKIWSFVWTFINRHTLFCHLSTCFYIRGFLRWEPHELKMFQFESRFPNTDNIRVRELDPNEGAHQNSKHVLLFLICLETVIMAYRAPLFACQCYQKTFPAALCLISALRRGPLEAPQSSLWIRIKQESNYRGLMIVTCVAVVSARRSRFREINNLGEHNHVNP